jgi:hypothetical protein
MNPFAYILLGLAGVLVGLGFVMPAVAQWRDLGTMPGSSVALLVLGLALAGAGLFSGVTGLRRRGN